MSKPVVYFFVKTFSEQSFCDQFFDGALYMNSLEYFAKLEENEDTGRGDRHEGVGAWLQPNEIQLEINGISINSADLAGPVSLQPTRHLMKNVFCMHAGYIGGDLPTEFATTEEFANALKISHENVSLGQCTVVLTNVQELLRRVKAAANMQGVLLRRGLVEYYDPSQFHGHFAESEVPFKKQMRFAHQREYRFVVDRQLDVASPYVLNVGSLRDIAHAISIDQLNAGIKGRKSECRS